MLPEVRDISMPRRLEMAPLDKNCMLPSLHMIFQALVFHSPGYSLFPKACAMIQHDHADIIAIEDIRFPSITAPPQNPTQQECDALRLQFQKQGVLRFNVMRCGGDVNVFGPAVAALNTVPVKCYGCVTGSSDETNNPKYHFEPVAVDGYRVEGDETHDLYDLCRQELVMETLRKIATSTEQVSVPAVIT